MEINTNSASLAALQQLPRQILDAQMDLNQKLIRTGVEEKVQNQTSPEHILDILV